MRECMCVRVAGEAAAGQHQGRSELEEGVEERGRESSEFDVVRAQVACSILVEVHSLFLAVVVCVLAADRPTVPVGQVE